MASIFLELLTERWPVIAVGALTWLIFTIVQTLFSGATLSQIPIVGLEIGDEEKRRMAYLTSAKKLYTDGYLKFKDGIFRFTTSRTSPVVVAPPRFLGELQKLPDNVLSIGAAIDETMESKYTKIEAQLAIIPSTIKSALTPALVRLNPVIAAETKEAVDSELGRCQNWTELNINHKLLRIVAKVSGRIFIGPELCHSEDYLDAAINYTTDVVEAQQAVQMMKPWQRWLRAPFLPQVKKLNQRLVQADAFLRPVVNARRKAALQPGYEKPDDMLQWLMDSQAKFGQKDDKEYAKIQLILSFAAIHTTTLTATNAFYNLAAMPEVVAELREEVQAALDENNGTFTSSALQSMKKLDSFLKETLRFHPFSFASFQRKVLRQFTLSNGQVIPAGVTIEVPAYPVSFDPNIFPECDRFDPLRFYKLRQIARGANSTGTKAAEAAAQNQFVSVNQSSLTFGYGRHACPGRFFAANEIKMILSVALLGYDVKCAEGSEGRYTNLEFAHMSFPDSSKTLLFKSVA
ncbi:cytochrome P450 [Lineolata rhizophorae]|uniref:Cytochrome P450 n=1 Tax=Lineolata rhizophorae TaxID=578093 RepID=A0A6A6NLI9_9PEZI|nr:cytochrome P450 [Lineolata rhizophorae]